MTDTKATYGQTPDPTPRYDLDVMQEISSHLEEAESSARACEERWHGLMADAQQLRKESEAHTGRALAWRRTLARLGYVVVPDGGVHPTDEASSL